MSLGTPIAVEHVRRGDLLRAELGGDQFIHYVAKKDGDRPYGRTLALIERPAKWGGLRRDVFEDILREHTSLSLPGHECAGNGNTATICRLIAAVQAANL